MNKAKNNKVVFSQKELEKIKQFLPNNYLSLIKEAINNKICIRQIRFVLQGKQKDNHGVIEALIKIADEHKSYLKTQKEKMKILLQK